MFKISAAKWQDSVRPGRNFGGNGENEIFRVRSEILTAATAATATAEKDQDWYLKNFLRSS